MPEPVPLTRASVGLDVHIISPSGVVLDSSRVDEAMTRLAGLGLRPKLDRAALNRDRRFAGSDRTRIAAINRASRSKADIVMMTRGGYGLTRILGQLDFPKLAAANKRWVGFSDFTAFQLAMLAKAGAPTWSGPALLDDFTEREDQTTHEVFMDAMTSRLQVLGFKSRGPANMDATGTLWGGNLSMVCALLGTPFFPRVRGGILFLEDVGEHPYRIERLLTQLIHAGVIGAQKAVLLGTFNGYKAFAHDGGFDLPDVIRGLRRATATPIIEGLPFGHNVTKLTLPHGRKIGLASERGQTYLLMPDAHSHE